MSREADPLTGTSIVQFERGGNNARAPAQEIADLTGMGGGEVVRVRRGKRWAKTTVADIAGGINGSDIVTIKQGKRHVRTTAQSIADLGVIPYVEGPLDLVPGATLAYGQRALSVARLGQPIFTLRRDVDDAELAFNADAVTGDAPFAAIAAWVGAAFTQTGAITNESDIVVLADSTGVHYGQPVSGAGIQPGTTVIDTSGLPSIYISLPATATNGAAVLTFTRMATLAIWHDQSGNGEDLVSLSPDNFWYPTIQGGKPGFLSFDNNDIRASTTASFPNSVATVFLVGSENLEWLSIEGVDFLDFSTGQSGGVFCNLYKDPNGAGIYIAAPPAGVHLWDAAIEWGATNFRVDGVTQAPTLSNDGAAPPAALTETPLLEIGEGMIFCEGVIYNTRPSDPNRLAIRQNIATFYGIAL